MYESQLAMFVLEAGVMVSIILGLFRARTVLGLTPLYIVLGGFQYFEATLNVQAQVAPGFWLNPASTVMFTTTLVTVLIIYVKEDALEARKLLYGLVLANAGVAIISLLIGWHVTLDGTVSTGISRAHFIESARVAMAGTSLLFLDVLGIILMYEFVSQFVGALLPRFLLSLVAIVAFDQMLFTLLVHSGRPDMVQVLFTGLVGKVAAAAFYSVACWAYFRFGEPHTATVGTGDVADVFHTLTYRQKYEQARQRMVRDGLTGLYNRGYFDEALPQALAHAKRYGESVSLLIIDTDNFKSINDQLSHMEGDQALRVIADVLQSQARPSDTPCRYGGDEFVVLLAQADAAAAAAFAERFRAALLDRCRTASPPFAWGYVTTTIGVATYPADGEPDTPADFIRTADRRLYVGKQAGRDMAITPGHELDAPTWRPARTA
ncbi:MAG TPA: GGDEF domain-containing protein [Vicinamibacterales bacterium]|nr:GGDEF domain-containing protein [Vicinamibacterales bacterium]